MGTDQRMFEDRQAVEGRAVYQSRPRAEGTVQ